MVTFETSKLVLVLVNIRWQHCHTSGNQSTVVSNESAKVKGCN